jgi:ribosomal protein S18 acetylase RimI-like enzyme
LTTSTVQDTHWQISDDWDEFSSVARPYLASEPERNTLPITVLDAVISGRFRVPPPTFGWHRSGSSIDGAALMTPPFELILATSPDQAAALGHQLRDDDFAVPGVNAEPDLADAFSSAYLEDSRATSVLKTQMLLYRLGRLVEPPSAADGAGRIANSGDFELCLNWFNEMRAEVEGTTGDQSDLVHRRLDAGLVWLWEAAGEAVSLASRAPEAAGVARIGPVYTPPRSRRRGFASAVTHACARDALEQGASSVVLFTDLSNPTSNSIYQTIGFRPIGERVVLEFAEVTN